MKETSYTIPPTDLPIFNVGDIIIVNHCRYRITHLQSDTYQLKAVLISPSQLQVNVIKVFIGVFFGPAALWFIRDI